MADVFNESRVFDSNLSIWEGILKSNELDDYNPLPLDFYTAASLGETEMVTEYLKRKECHANDMNRNGWSALMYACYMGHDVTSRCLMRAGADLSLTSSSGSSPLILASMCGNDNIIKILLEQGVDIDAVDNIGWSAIFHAASAGHQTTTELLIECGANCDITEPSQGLTPLMEAAASGHEIIVQQFLQKGVDINVLDQNGDNAWSLAHAYGHVKIAGMIERYENKRVKHPKSAQSAQQKPASAQKRGGGDDNLKGNLSFPSIHAGPKAFAQMTGLGADGKPHPQANNAQLPLYLHDDNPAVEELPLQSKWTGPKDLKSFLAAIGLEKYYSKFADEDIDLHIFLTLSEADLKEIGITLFGPRRKMMSAIQRSINEMQVTVKNCPVEIAYADALAAKVTTLQSEAKEVEMEKNKLERICEQEQELRKVTESFLMEQRGTLSSLHNIQQQLDTNQKRLSSIVQDTRTSTMTKQFDNLKTKSRSSPNGSKERSSPIPSMKDLEEVIKVNRDCLNEMKRILNQSSSSIESGRKSSKDAG